MLHPRSLAIWILSALVVLAQQQPVAQPDGSYTISTTTQLVVETVIVNDKSGKAIEGLTAKDFAITEDGVPQTIQFCEFQKLVDTPAPPLAEAPPWLPRHPNRPSPKSPRTKSQPKRRATSVTRTAV